MSNGTPAVLKSLQEKKKKAQTLGIPYKCSNYSLKQKDFSTKCVFTLNKLIPTFTLDSPLKLRFLSSQFPKLCNPQTSLLIIMLDLRKL